MPDVTAVALRMLTNRGNKAEIWATDHAFGNDAGPARDFWLAVEARIRELRRVRVG